MSSDTEETQQVEKPFAAERAKTGRAKCKRCKCTIEKDELRIAKMVTNFFSDGKLMASWHHVNCMFDVFASQRATTKKIDDPVEDVKGWDELCDEDQRIILDKLGKSPKTSPQKAGVSRESTEKKSNKQANKGAKIATDNKERKKDKKEKDKKEDRKVASEDDTFREFQRVCTNVAENDAYTDKTAIIRRVFTKGLHGNSFKGDVVLWCKLLLPGVVKRVYNLQSKQLIKLFARLLLQDEDEMLEHFEQGDVAETISVFFEKSVAVSPCTTSVLTIQDVDLFLEQLSRLTKEMEQIKHFQSFLDKCTSNDLKTIIRLIKHDLRINAGPKHILEAVHADAYRAFQMSRDLEAVLRRFLPNSEEEKSCAPSSSHDKVAIALMTPVLPMLAEACTSVEMAMQKCPNGMLSEIKYDGERVQVHKNGSDFRYFSRSLKAVMPHKVNLFADYIIQAFPDGDDLILDSEVLMVDNETGEPLPFGTLGIHKKAQFKNANVCLFIFDCLYYNGEILIDKSIQERRNILKDRITEIPNRIMLSEVHEVHDSQDLVERIIHVLKLGHEGLVLKDIDGKYEPGKRHWLKVKKDYLCGGAMADSADLVVLGAWYGTGNKGGIMSIFLMGCYDEERDRWLTVTKVHTGHDDSTLAALQDELDMVKIGKDVEKLPKWLLANKSMVPDFIARDPKKQPVWEITGAEFTNQGIHTADISIRFPRVTRIRHDKDWSTATTLNELRKLFQKKPESIDFSLLLKKDFKDIPRKKQSTPSTSPRKKSEITKRGTSSPSEPSTSFGIGEGPSSRNVPDNPEVEEESHISEKSTKRRKRDKYKEEFNGVESIQSKRKKFKIARDEMEEKTREEESEDNLTAGRNIEELIESSREALDSDVEDTESSNILQHVRASLAPGFDSTRRKYARRMLRMLGATLVNIPENRSTTMTTTTTHIIHARTEIPSTAVHEDFADFPKTAKHVNVSWLEETAAQSRKQDESWHAVKLVGDYCKCPCTHQ